MKEEKRGRTFKGFISLIVLRTLWNEPGYGYNLEKEINRGLGVKLSNGEIYSVLRNMEIRGLIKYKGKRQEGKKRKYYEISSEGKQYLQEQVENMEVALPAIEEIIVFVNSNSSRGKEGSELEPSCKNE
ncbi:MAG: PadR family transcriptional regulator [Thermoplasmatales archaeon]|nr:PadR family transcriptional regulator [Thermoplasmatales archaeon]